MAARFVTVGEALLAKGTDNWRAELRANGIDRRPSSSAYRAEPDRGHVEQPGERRPESRPESRPEPLQYADKPPAQTLVWLGRRSVPSKAASDMPQNPVPPEPPPPPAPIVAPAAPPPGPSDSSGNRRYTKGFKLAAVARVLNGERQKEVALDLGIAKSMLSVWCNGRGMERNAPGPEKPFRIEKRERERWQPKRGPVGSSPKRRKRRCSAACARGNPCMI